MPIKLIAMDLDGTLLNSGSELPAENVAAIREAASRGIDIVIVTGRRFNSARLIVDELSCDAQLIGSNGAVIKSKSGETLYRRLLPVNVARQILNATEDYRAYTGVIFDRPDDRQVIFERIDWEGPFIGPYLRRHRHQVAEVAPLTECLDGEDPVEVLFIGECAVLRRLLATLETLPIVIPPNETVLILEYSAVLRSWACSCSSGLPGCLDDVACTPCGTSYSGVPACTGKSDELDQGPDRSQGPLLGGFLPQPLAA